MARARGAALYGAGMTFALIALGAGIAVSVELLEALAIVLAVASTRRWSDALAGVFACALLAALLGPVILASVSVDALRVSIGFLLLLFGLEWLRKGTLRLAGRRAPSSSMKEFLKARERSWCPPRAAGCASRWSGLRKPS